MKQLKYALIALGALLVLVAGALVYIAITFDPNDYREDLQRLVADRTGRTLTLAGDLRLTVFPKIGVGLGATTLSEAGSEQAFAEVRDLRVALAVLPLLRGRVVVDEIVVDGRQARLVQRADGTRNIDDLLAPREAPAPAEAADEAGDESKPPIELDIEGVRLTDAALTFVDEAAGRSVVASALSLTTGRVAAGVETAFRMAAQIKADAPVLDLALEGSGALRPDWTAGRYTVKPLQLTVRGQAAAVRALEATLSAALELTSARSALEGVQIDVGGQFGEERFSAQVRAPRLTLEGNALDLEKFTATAKGRVADVDLSEAALAVPRLSLALERQYVRLEGLTMSARGRQAANTFELAVSAPRLEITPVAAGGEQMSAQLKAAGPDLAAEASLRLSGVQGTARALRIGQVVLELDGRQAEQSVRGRVSTPVSADLETQRFELSALSGQFDLRAPSLPQGRASVPIAGKATAALKAEQLNSDLALSFQQSKIQAKLGLQGFARPYYTFDVAVDQLDADRYRGGRAAPGGQPDAKPQEQESPFDLSPLKALHLDGSLRVGRLTYAGVRAANVRIDVSAKDGRLVLAPIAANLYDGAIDGRATVDAGQNEFTVKQTLTGVSVGPLLRDAMGKEPLSGRGNVALDLQATGTTVSALRQSMSGSAALALRDGAIKGINLAQSLRNASTLLSAGRVSESAATATQQTDFSDLTASFTIREGKARNDDLEVKSPFLRLKGGGEIDIGRGALDYTTQATLVASASGQGGRGAEDLAGLTVPVRVSGPWDALTYKLDFGSAVGADARERLERKKDALKQKLEGQITDKLLGGEAPPPEGESAAPPGDQGAPPAKPQDELKQRLRNLFR